MKRGGRAGRGGALRRRTRTAVRQARPGLTTAAPQCCTCGKPLVRIPSSLVSGTDEGGRFQCSDCFYPGVGPGPAPSRVVSSERARWWAELMEGDI